MGMKLSELTTPGILKNENNGNIISDSTVGVVPVGTVFDFAGSSAPSGYLMCDGSAVLRTTYSALFAVIGTTYGSGDGSTTFNVPDGRGRVAVCKSTDTEFNTLGKKDGEKTHTLITGEMPTHNHGILGASGVSNQIANPGAGWNIVNGNKTDQGVISIANTGGGSAHNNLQPYIVYNSIIKY